MKFFGLHLLAFVGAMTVATSAEGDNGNVGTANEAAAASIDNAPHSTYGERQLSAEQFICLNLRQMPFSSHESEAAAKEGHLISIADEELNSAVAALKRPYSGPAFIGGTDQAVEGQWKWIDGASWSYTNWNPGQPSGQDCLGIKGGGKWYAQSCGNRLKGIYLLPSSPSLRWYKCIPLPSSMPSSLPSLVPSASPSYNPSATPSSAPSNPPSTVETKIIGLLTSAKVSLEALSSRRLGGRGGAHGRGGGSANTDIFQSNNKAVVTLDKVVKAIQALTDWVDSDETEVAFLEDAKGLTNAATNIFCKQMSDEKKTICEDLASALVFLEEELEVL